MPERHPGPGTHAPRRPLAHPPLLDLLRCPLCHDPLEAGGGSLRCRTRHHTFDIARQGYVSLLTGDMRTGSADTAPMVAARTAFLTAGHYAPLARALAELAPRLCPPDGVVLDAGTGTGYYLAAVLDALPGAHGLGLDASKHALRQAARAHPRAGAAAWDLWRPFPVRGGAAHLLLNVFAPRNGAEFHRVLRADGHLLVVTPTPRHLAEVREQVGGVSVDADKERRLDDALAEHFRREHVEDLEYPIRLDAAAVRDAVAMGPTARHLGSPEELRRRTAHLADPLPVTASFRLSHFRPRRPPADRSVR
ncbi:putative RNA methyltransferase [Allostreptomyces psammosilenae]|uniref:23S rRNA (Guanine745-N1)-methyltransferase n=1 Tax=Allostreptomyces psammosilenae TaxID=1892865 RepID=A0A852ZVA4_9ACTN|nr:Trm112 family protein [Allostreptomyces psammosilenae]NYI06306.1 23S rRNA (guanine745-N1)-methyltransferase [Allostreptomyces psammosilenae]